MAAGAGTETWLDAGCEPKWQAAGCELERLAAEIWLAMSMSCLSHGAVPHSCRGFVLGAPNFQRGMLMRVASVAANAACT